MSAIQNPELSIIIPAFNEEKLILSSLEKVRACIRQMDVGAEIIVINDGSTDATLERLTSLKEDIIKLISYPANKGKGYAINQGIQLARGKYHLFMDVDLSTDLNALETFLNRAREGIADVLIGNRNYKPIWKQDRPLLRAFLGRTFTLLSSWTLGCRIDDFTCGFKLFTAQASKAIFSRQRIFGWAFDSEIIFIAQHLKLRIEQIPVIWHHCPDSKVRIASDIKSALGELWRIRSNQLKGYYNH